MITSMYSLLAQSCWICFWKSSVTRSMEEGVDEVVVIVDPVPRTGGGAPCIIGFPWWWCCWWGAIGCCCWGWWWWCWCDMIMIVCPVNYTRDIWNLPRTAANCGILLFQIFFFVQSIVKKKDRTPDAKIQSAVTKHQHNTLSLFFLMFGWVYSNVSIF